MRFVPFDLELIGRIAHVGERIFRGQPATPYRKGRCPALSNLGGYLLFMHTPMTQNYQI